MSEQPIILPTSTRSDQRAGKYSFARNMVILGLSLLAVFVVVLSLSSTFSAPEAAPVVVESPEPYITPEPKPTEDLEPVAPAVDELYDDCAAVWAVLDRPIFREDEGYRDSLDWDGDGIGCEDNPATAEDESSTDWASVRERFRENLEDIGDAVTPIVKDFWDDARNFFEN